MVSGNVESAVVAESQILSSSDQAASSLVSVIIPAYKSAVFIRAALTSVLQQTYSPYEIIVVNDGSPDTPELEGALRPFGDRIRYLVQPHGGPGAARNTALHVARGSLIAFLDADDRWYPQFLADQIFFLENARSYDLVYCDALICGRTPLAGRRFMSTAPSRGPVTLENLLRQRCAVILSGVVGRTEALRAVGGFDATLRRGQDFDLWIRFVHHGFRIAYTRKVLLERHARPEQRVSDLLRLIKVLNKTAQTLQLQPRARAALRQRLEWAHSQLHFERGKQQLLSGNFERARESLRSARSLKARLAAVSIRLAPTVIRRLYLWRRTRGG